jgi:gliding motility-associated-like protein
MRFDQKVRLFFRLLLFVFPACFFSQPSYEYIVSTTPEICNPGSAALSIKTILSTDTVEINWSGGQRNVYTVRNLSEGDYSISINIRRWQDSVLYISDTLITFSVSKEICPISFPKYFSPNSDGYKDELLIGNIDKYPEFELGIYNKWGQKVHGQKNTYIPWNGTWNGVPLPDGAYYYVLFYDARDRNNLVKGDLTILR